jgi:hypothetical protein
MSILYGSLIVTLVNVEAEVNGNVNENNGTDNISIFIRNCAMPSIALLYVPVLLSMYPYNVYCKVSSSSNSDDLNNSTLIDKYTLIDNFALIDNFITKVREPCSKNNDIVCEIVTQCKKSLKV